jgi:putative MATE family efflux protein
MPRNYKKNTKYANVFKAAREAAPKAEEGIAKTPTKKHLLKFAFPTILSVLIMSTFGIVDGIFVSRIIDPIALSAVSIVFPFLSFVMAIGFMLGVGGNALIAKKIGAGLEKEGRENFSLIVLVAFVTAVVIAIIGIASPDLILNVLGTDDFVRPMALQYMQPLLYFMPMIVLGMVFQQFLITVGKAHYSAVTSFLGGLISAGLNYLFIYLMGLGLQGAAMATSIGYTLPALVGLTYFTFKRSGSLYFVMPKPDFRALGKACVNGASEMVTMLSTSITAVLMNNILMEIEGPQAVAAAGIMFAGLGIFTSLFIGYSSGVVPIISYNYGKGDTQNLKRAYANSLSLIGIISLTAIGLALLSTDLIMMVYGVPMGTPIYDMATFGFRVFTAGFIFLGFNAFGSMWFSALNNGIVSSALSLFNALIFVVITLMVLPQIFGLNGAWMAIPAADVMGIFLTFFFFDKMKQRYKYA